MQSFEIRRHVLQGKAENGRVLTEPEQFLQNLPGYLTIQRGEIFSKSRSFFETVH